MEQHPPAPDPALLAALAALRGLTGSSRVPTEGDLRRAAASIAPLLPVAAAPEARAWDLEPALSFDPTLPFADLPPAPWPASAAVPHAPRRGAGEGDLVADLATVAAGADPAEIAGRYRAAISARNPELNAFLTLCPADHPQARAGAPGGPLRGAAVALKDNIATAGLPTTGGSVQRARFVPGEDAVCWAALRAAGALCLGKTNLHEFAAGTTNENENFGPARNPHDPSRVAGGSSGGSAAAVAAALAPAALGTDTAGSIRIPAACCGVVGLKPTYGWVSRRGVFPLSWSLDHVGPLAGSVRAVGLLLAALGGERAVGRGRPAPSGAARASGLRGVRIGIPWSWLEEAGESAQATGGIPTASVVRIAFARCLEVCRGLGATLVPVDLGSADFATAVNRLIALPESTAWHAPHLEASPARYGERVRGRLLAGGFVSAEAYLQAQRLRALLARRYAAVLAGPAGVHLIATPTLPLPAPAVGAPPAEGLALLRFCAPFNLVGWPALSLPCGRSPTGLPFGLQLAAAPRADGELLQAAASLEEALGTSR